MKTLLALATTLLIASSPTFAAEGKHLFILSGQSNMVGLKPEASFTPAVEKAFGKDQVIVVKDAQSGCPIRRWVKDWKPAPGASAPGDKQAPGDLYDRLMGVVRPAIEGQSIATVTFLWMQGERDAKEGHGEVYAQSFKSLLAQLKKDLGGKDIAFVIGRISDHGVKPEAQYPHWTMVRDVQVKLGEGEALGAWVDTDDLNGKGDGLHYSGEGYQKLGERFAEAAIRLVGKQAAAKP
ncbi:MAG TPA: sialate O-acetylesterase [Luteolibacter sp.]|nr:sialate O-acetylesterase [Luteolibacter sp.]